MYKWSLHRADVNLWYVFLFVGVGICLVYGVDYIYSKLKKKNEQNRSSPVHGKKAPAESQRKRR